MSENKVRTLVESKDFKSAVANVLPAHLTPDRFVRISIAALTRTPKLLDCDPNTVLQCMMQLSQFGLEPDGRNAHLIPFGNTCQLIIDYKGLVDLAMRSGKVAFIHASKVCENDNFKFDKGQVERHVIDFKKDRGSAYAYYALARMKDGTEQTEAMTKDEVQAIRKRSRAANNGPWVTDFDEMAKKTVFRRLSKWLQLSPEFREALEVDADALEELRFEQAIPITRPKIGRLKGNKREIPSETILRGTQWEESSDGGGGFNALSEHPTAAAAPKDGGDANARSGQTRPTVSAAPTVQPASAATKKKLKGLPSSDPTSKAEVANRLTGMHSSISAFVDVARLFNVIRDDQDWKDITEEKFEVCLEPDNWQMIVEALEK